MVVPVPGDGLAGRAVGPGTVICQADARPPSSGAPSIRVTSWPSCARRWASISPSTPPPTTPQRAIIDPPPSADVERTIVRAGNPTRSRGTHGRVTQLHDRLSVTP